MQFCGEKLSVKVPAKLVKTDSKSDLKKKLNVAKIKTRLNLHIKNNMERNRDIKNVSCEKDDTKRGVRRIESAFQSTNHKHLIPPQWTTRIDIKRSFSRVKRLEQVLRLK